MQQKQCWIQSVINGHRCTDRLRGATRGSSLISGGVGGPAPPALKTCLDGAIDGAILDDLGQLPFAKSASQLLFHLLSHLCERFSIIPSTNLAFEEWPTVMGGTKMIRRPSTAHDPCAGLAMNGVSMPVWFGLRPPCRAASFQPVIEVGIAGRVALHRFAGCVSRRHRMCQGGLVGPKMSAASTSAVQRPPSASMDQIPDPSISGTLSCERMFACSVSIGFGPDRPSPV